MTNHKLSKRLIVLILLTFLGAAPAFGQSAGAAIQNMINQFVGIMNAHQDNATRIKKIKPLYDQYFDTELLSKTTLRYAWKELTPAQQKTFARKFGQFIFLFYSSRVGQYEGNKIKVENVRTKGQYALVDTSFSYKGSNIEIDYRMINQGGQWRIYDVTIEGVRISSTYRTQFSDVLKRSSFAGLEAELDKLIAKYN